MSADYATFLASKAPADPSSGFCGIPAPWTVQCGDGRAIAGHVQSREIADAIAAALNQAHSA